MLAFHDGFDRRQNARGEAGQRLAPLHQIQIVLGCEGKGRQDLVQHVAVLRRHAYFHREFVWPRPQPVNQRTKLDALRARSEDAENADHRRRTFTRVGRHKVSGGTTNTPMASSDARFMARNVLAGEETRFRKKSLGTR